MRIPSAVALAAAGLAIVLFASSVPSANARAASMSGHQRVSAPQASEEDYKEFRKKIGELFAQKKYAEAAVLLESGLAKYPGHVVANAYNLAAMRVLMGEKDKALDALHEGHRRGVFYGKWDFLGKTWEGIRETDGFQAFLKRNESLIEEAQKKTEMKLEVRLPEGYDPARKWPLFIALHGGGESIAEFAPNWTSPRLRREFIVAYVLSTQVASMTGFHWQDEAVTRKDLTEAYRRIMAGYPVDGERVIVGGFSSGGFASLIVSFGELFPVRGFVALCPPVPESLTDEAIAAAVKRGLRGALLTTELDNRVEEQKKLAERWGKLGLEHEFAVTPNIGHWFPEDFADRLDRALTYILGRAHLNNR